MKGTLIRSLAALACVAGMCMAQANVGTNTCLNPVTPPSPGGGQANGSVSLTLNAFGQGGGPTEYWVPGGASVTATHIGPNANLILLAGVPVTGFLTAPGISIDIDIFTGVLCVYDALNTGIGAPCVLPPQGNPTVLPFTVPTGITAQLISVQGFGLDPAAPIGLSASARMDIGVQNVTGLGAPGMPPMPSTIVVTPVPAPPNQPGHCSNIVGGSPLVGPTTTLYPYPRDAICPNIGPIGTVHSALGANFDATAPGLTTATVNGIPVNITLVRPNEIKFTMSTAHIPTIAGALVVTSTGGTYTPSGDQMESWVFVSPPVSSILVEPPLTGFGGGASGGISGTFSTPSSPLVSGLYGAIGRKDANNQQDYYRFEGLSSGTTVRAVLAQLDGTIFQVRSQCSGIPPAPAGICNISTGQLWSQQWFANSPNCWNDTYLHQGLGDGSGNPGPSSVTIAASQDDGGPGVASFFGNSGIPTPGTLQSADPDGPLTATDLDWFIADDFGNFYPVPADVVPYRYILLVYF